MKGERVRHSIRIRTLTVILVAFLALMPSAHARAQERPLSAAGPVEFPEIGHVRRPAAAHYDLIAIRVEFQPDSSSYSTGDGTFGGTLFEGAEPPGVDPLPHDEDYFEAHLAFLENYVRKVSDGRSTVTTHLLPVVVRVGGAMAEYAPIGSESSSDEELRKLASLVEESWTRASELDSFDMPDGLDPEHTAFVLFHAGIGRDVELLGTTLDKTPEDLPSIFFSGETLDRLLGSFNVSVDGVPILNSMLIPRTESRRGVDVLTDEPFVAELSINGLLAASFLSYLGVPDLFDTATGASAIGPFGVMDGLGIFAYSGLLPPEPSAWTKWYLGWTDAPEVMDGPQGVTVTMKASGSSDANPVFLAPISEDEFFLVENRNRDLERDGLNLRIWRDGETSIVHFDHGAEGFSSNSTSAFPGGVIVDADNFDFALPGGLDPDGNVLQGGVLVWHVDESRLRAGLADNSVNADPDGRSVDLEEADGAQDIGFPSVNPFGPSFDTGSPFDFFYEGNPTTVITGTGSEIRLYENRFGPDTYPSSAANDGGTSFVEFSDFSVPGPEMTFLYRRVDVRGISVHDDKSFVFDDGGGAMDRPEALYHVASPAVDFAAFGRSEDGAGALSWAKSGTTLGIATGLVPALPVLSVLGVAFIAPDGFYRLRPDGTIGVEGLFPDGMSPDGTTTPVVELSNGRLVVGLRDAEGDLVASVQDGNVTIERLSEPLLSLAVVDGLRDVRFFRDHAEIPSLDRDWSYDRISETGAIQGMFARHYGGTPGADKLFGVVPDPGGQRLVLLLNDGGVRYVEMGEFESLGVSGPPGPLPLVADLDGDHLPDVLFSAGNTLMGVTMSGAIVDGFPVEMRTPAKAQPLLVRLEQQGPLAAIVAADDGRIDAYDLESRYHRVPGFPLPFGSAAAGSPVLSNTVLTALSSTGRVGWWEFEAAPSAVWGRARGQRNNSFVELGDPGNYGTTFEGDQRSGILVDGETYNWPNPIRDGVTWIRFQPRSRSDVEITIVDMAGRLMERLQVSGAPGAVSSEVQWKTDAGSGIYLARVTATSESGGRDTALIKMAIIR